MNIKNSINLTVLFVCLVSMHCFAHEQQEESKMSASGNFEIKLEPQKDELAPVGRMIIDKKYSGEMVGTGIGQMISKRTTDGAAAYSAIEEFKGSVDGKKGEFTLIHIGYMSKDSQSLEVTILEGSGNGDLKNIKGKLLITQENGGHSYELIYEL